VPTPTSDVTLNSSALRWMLGSPSRRQSPGSHGFGGRGVAFLHGQSMSAIPALDPRPGRESGREHQNFERARGYMTRSSRLELAMDSRDHVAWQTELLQEPLDLGRHFTTRSKSSP